MHVYKFLKNPDKQIYRRANHITLDCETTNLDYGDSICESNRLVCTGWLHSRTNRLEFQWGGMGKLEQLLSAIEDEEVFVVGHNIKFDLRWLAKYGLDLSRVLVWDTMVAEHVFYGNRPSSIRLDLGSVAKRYGYAGKEPYIDKCIKGGVCPSELPASLLKRRNIYDVRVTELVFRKQLERAINEDKLGVMLTRFLVTPVLADIETNGLYLNEKRVEDEYYRAIKEYDDIESVLTALKDINWNSPKQVGEYIYEELGFKEIYGRDKSPIRTDTGRYKADVSTIRQLTAKTKEQRDIQELLSKRSILEAQLSKSLTKFKECIDNGELLYANFNQAVTQTHRLSSSGTKYGVQFQNLPRIFKPLISARNEGWKIREVDGAQLEFRVAAFLGRDQQALYDIENGVDVHAYTRDTITEAGQKIDRQEAKAHTFKPLFGGRSGTKAEQTYYEAFKQKYAAIHSTQEGWKTDAIRNKKFRMASGLEFFFPTIKAPRNKDGWIAAESSIYNYPIQSFATADIIPISLVYTWHEMKHLHLQSFIVNTVHDSIIMEENPEETGILDDISLAAFGNQCYNYLYEVYNVEFNVPLGCGIKIGDNWGEGEERKYNLPTPFK